MMEPFVEHEGLVAPLDRRDVDTDQIIPQRFLRKISRTGFGPDLFANLRYLGDDTTPNPDFVLNQPRYAGASILLARDNFGCGSSPEGTVYRFAIDAFRKESLLRGLDAIGRTEQYNSAIDAYEARRRDEAPWLFVSG